jgi:SPP1 gp7 family putative phage head morphogenesis protein
MSTVQSRGALATNLATVETRLDHLAEHGGPNVDDVPANAKLALALAEPALNEDRAPAGPTRTKTVQSDYSAEMYKRFRRLKGVIRATVAANDAFGLGTGGDRDAGTLEAQATSTDSYDFPTRAGKVDAFLDDLQAWQDDEILEVFQRGRNGRVVSRDAWQDIYVRRSYSKGVEFADARLREQGIEVPSTALAELFNAPIHAEAVGLLYTRNFRELAGITEAMDQQISRVLAEGFAQGHNPRKMASAINDRVDKVGLTRARTLARTEVINAHSEATLNRYESILGPDAEVVGKAELSTAGDSRVCDICAGIEGQVVSIDGARGIIPVHPNCRCAWLPVPSESTARNIARRVA